MRNIGEAMVETGEMSAKIAGKHNKRDSNNGVRNPNMDRGGDALGTAERVKKISLRAFCRRVQKRRKTEEKLS